jgi:hypothetical protein
MPRVTSAINVSVLVSLEPPVGVSRHSLRLLYKCLAQDEIRLPIITLSPQFLPKFDRLIIYYSLTLPVEPAPETARLSRAAIFGYIAPDGGIIGLFGRQPKAPTAISPAYSVREVASAEF